MVLRGRNKGEEDGGDGSDNASEKRFVGEGDSGIMEGVEDQKEGSDGEPREGVREVYEEGGNGPLWHVGCGLLFLPAVNTGRNGRNRPPPSDVNAEGDIEGDTGA